MKRFLVVCTMLFTVFLVTNAYADIIGVDFGTPQQATPTNWTSISSAGNYSSLGTETGVSTNVGLVVSGVVGGSPLNFNAVVNASTIPSHTNSLANIGQNIYQFGIADELGLTINGLEAGRSYDVWIFGLRTSANSQGLAQDVDIQPGAIHFDQVAGSGNIFVNNTLGDSATDLSTYAAAITASAGGEITISVTADGGDNLYAVAGLAIDIPSPTATSIPTISEWGMFFMSLLLSGTALWVIRRRQIS